MCEQHQVQTLFRICISTSLSNIYPDVLYKTRCFCFFPSHRLTSTSWRRSLPVLRRPTSWWGSWNSSTAPLWLLSACPPPCCSTAWLRFPSPPGNTQISSPFFIVHQVLIDILKTCFPLCWTGFSSSFLALWEKVHSIMKLAGLLPRWWLMR